MIEEQTQHGILFQHNGRDHAMARASRKARWSGVGIRPRLGSRRAIGTSLHCTAVSNGGPVCWMG